MDPTNSSSMQKFKLCEISSCTDLPILDENEFYSGSDESGAESEDDSGLVMISPSKHREKILSMSMVNEGIRVMSYAVRGPLLLRANEIEKELKDVIISFVSFRNIYNSIV